MRPRRAGWRSAIPPAGWAYVAWATISLGWSLAPEVAMGALATLLQLFLIALLIADFVVQRPTIVRPVLWAYSISAAATALIGTEAYIAQGLGTARAGAIQNQDPAQFAAVLLPALVFAVFEMISGERRILGGAIALMTTAGVVVSGTRGAWVACAIVLLLVVLPQLTPRRRVATLILVCSSPSIRSPASRIWWRSAAAMRSPPGERGAPTSGRLGSRSSGRPRLPGWASPTSRLRSRRMSSAPPARQVVRRAGAGSLCRPR
jgi:hypothetical protein